MDKNIEKLTALYKDRSKEDLIKDLAALGDKAQKEKTVNERYYVAY